jgi:hypothetical protein
VKFTADIKLSLNFNYRQRIVLVLTQNASEPLNLILLVEERSIDFHFQLSVRNESMRKIDFEDEKQRLTLG